MSDLIEHMALIKMVAEQQAEDPTIWGESKYITEAILQAEIRRLHHVIETGQLMLPAHLEEGDY